MWQISCTYAQLELGYHQPKYVLINTVLVEVPATTNKNCLYVASR